MPLLDDLENGPEYRFECWPNKDVPLRTAGVYTIWHGSQFMYVGMSGQKMKTEDPEPPDEPKKAKGLFERLGSHASGRRSGDQFCVYVCDRLVVPTLNPKEQQQLALAEISLDEKTMEYIHENLTYRWSRTDDGKEALAIEKTIQREGLGKAGKPFLNPIPPAYRKRKPK